MWGPSLARRVSLAAATAACAIVVTACGGDEPDLVAGKQQFVAKCGSCHVLGRAGTKGTAGPNLDEAFQQSLKAGMGRGGIEPLVHDWIIRPNPASPMPAKLATGKEAEAIAAYVASTVARGGEDRGLLATAVKAAGSEEPAEAEGGVLEIAADPGGQLLYVTSKATAPAGELEVRSPNPSSVPHNIVIDGKGEGEVVEKGKVSAFKATFEAGKYQYYCSVQGHKEAGMVGELTVE
jgi:plastocyanin